MGMVVYVDAYVCGEVLVGGLDRGLSGALFLLGPTVFTV